MKRALLITLTIPLLMGLNGIGAIGQNYGDDIYYTPSQSKKEREAARKANAEREAALRAEWAKQRALEENYADDDESDTSDADIDAYNRRGTDKNQLKRGYAFGKNKYGKKQRRAGTYSSRIARFHDPATIITDSRDGNVVVIIDNDRYGYGAYDYDYNYDYYGYNGNVTINLYPGYSYNSWYYPWYDAWYDPWFFYDPWFYTAWRYPRRPFGYPGGYYDPWWGYSGYGFGFGYSWNNGYYNGYRDGYRDGYWNGGGYDPYSGRYFDRSYSRNYYANGRGHSDAYTENNRIRRGRDSGTQGYPQNNQSQTRGRDEKADNSLGRGRYDRGTYWNNPENRTTDNDRYISDRTYRDRNSGRGRYSAESRSERDNSYDCVGSSNRGVNERRDLKQNRGRVIERGNAQRGRYDGISRGQVYRSEPDRTYRSSDSRVSRSSSYDRGSYGRGSYSAPSRNSSRSSSSSYRSSDSGRGSYSAPSRSSSSSSGSYSAPSRSSSPSSSSSSSGGHRGR